eukprot:23355-Chlamydomonas_euryale.AAC.1
MALATLRRRRRRGSQDVDVLHHRDVAASAAGQGPAGLEPANNARDSPRCVCWPEASAKRSSASVRIATVSGWQSERKAFMSSAGPQAGPPAGFSSAATR